jgi:hypothetical protein
MGDMSMSMAEEKDDCKKKALALVTAPDCLPDEEKHGAESTADDDGSRLFEILVGPF